MSQGSEFDELLGVLPERRLPVLTRELIHTAATRTRETLCLLAHESVLRPAVSRRTERTSGLREVLRDMVGLPA